MPKPQQHLPTESPTKAATDNLVANYLSSEIELLDYDMPDIDALLPATHNPPAGGKNITMAKQIHEEEQQQQQQPPPVKSGTKRKRVEVLPRQSGRPTTIDTLIRIDGEDDLEALQLHNRELILNGTTENGEKKSKTILTKCKTNITVNSQKQYLTYELFADTRRKELEIIKEQRDILQKVNAAESVLTSLLKKR
jgi:hypothetical protein